MARISLTVKGATVAFALVDDEDAAELTRWRWTLNDRGYAQRSTTVGSATNGTRRRVNVRMHRQILGLTHGDGVEVDHINGDPLDNRRENLRLVTHAQNHQNKHRPYGSSRYRGVSFDKRSGRWEARGTLDGRMHHVGLFADEEEAAAAAAAWRRAHMPFATN